MTNNGQPFLMALAARLQPDDRESYAELMSYLRSLPPGDEFFRLAQLLGFVSVIAEQLPETLGELLLELREQTKAAADYHAQVHARLASLPGEIAEGVEAGKIAAAMSERFRQLLAATGLQESTTVLSGAAKDIRALSGEIASTLKPMPQEYRSITSTISDELGRLKAASEAVRSHNADLVARERSAVWWLDVLVIVAVFLVGTWAGMLIDKRETSAAIADAAVQVERLQAAQNPQPLPSRRPHSAIAGTPAAGNLGKRVP